MTERESLEFEDYAIDFKEEPLIDINQHEYVVQDFEYDGATNAASIAKDPLADSEYVEAETTEMIEDTLEGTESPIHQLIPSNNSNTMQHNKNYCPVHTLKIHELKSSQFKIALSSGQFLSMDAKLYICTKCYLNLITEKMLLPKPKEKSNSINKKQITKISNSVAKQTSKILISNKIQTSSIQSPVKTCSQDMIPEDEIISKDDSTSALTNVVERCEEVKLNLPKLKKNGDSLNIFQKTNSKQSLREKPLHVEEMNQNNKKVVDLKCLELKLTRCDSEIKTIEQYKNKRKQNFALRNCDDDDLNVTKKRSLKTSYKARNCNSRNNIGMKVKKAIESNKIKLTVNNVTKNPNKIQVKRKRIKKVANINCPLCSRKIKYASYLKCHLESHKARPYLCQICKRKFDTNDKLKKHECVVKSDIYTCVKCNKTFKNYSSMKYHRLKIHDNIITFKCAHCKEGYVTKSNIRYHISSVHLKIKDSVCEICGKRFTCQSILNTHLRSHNPLKLVCHLCGCIYKSQNSLDIHLKLHKGLKNFQCDICKKCFTTRNTVESHIMNHLNIKPFECINCNKSYSCKSSYKYHMKTTHEGFTRADLRRAVSITHPSRRTLINSDIIAL